MAQWEPASHSNESPSAWNKNMALGMCVFLWELHIYCMEGVRSSFIWQMAVTIKVVHTMWPSLLVKCMPPWWCLPWTTTLQSYQRTSWCDQLHWPTKCCWDWAIWHGVKSLLRTMILVCTCHFCPWSVSSGLCMHVYVYCVFGWEVDPFLFVLGTNSPNYGCIRILSLRPQNSNALS